MGEKFREFRLYTSPKTWIRFIITIAYFLWAIAFIVVGLQPSTSDATSGDRLTIPSIHLDTTTEPVLLSDHRFAVPDNSVGAYYAAENKVFLMGHKATIFSDLKDAAPGDTVSFANDTYTIETITIEPKSAIDMTKILAPSDRPTLVLMTCHGTPLSQTDYSHRLILTATIAQP